MSLNHNDHLFQLHSKINNLAILHVGTTRPVVGDIVVWGDNHPICYLRSVDLFKCCTGLGQPRIGGSNTRAISDADVQTLLGLVKEVVDARHHQQSPHHTESMSSSALDNMTAAMNLQWQIMDDFHVSTEGTKRIKADIHAGAGPAPVTINGAVGVEFSHAQSVSIDAPHALLLTWNPQVEYHTSAEVIAMMTDHKLFNRYHYGFVSGLLYTSEYIYTSGGKDTRAYFGSIGAEVAGQANAGVSTESEVGISGETNARIFNTVAAVRISVLPDIPSPHLSQQAVASVPIGGDRLVGWSNIKIASLERM